MSSSLSEQPNETATIKKNKKKTLVNYTPNINNDNKTTITKIADINNNSPGRILASEQPTSLRVKRENMTNCRFC